MQKKAQEEVDSFFGKWAIAVYVLPSYVGISLLNAFGGHNTADIFDVTSVGQPPSPLMAIGDEHWLMELGDRPENVSSGVQVHFLVHNLQLGCGKCIELTYQ